MRIRELEEENRQLKIQNEKQQALMNKYRERWEKLKESAKKRRAQPEQVRMRFLLVKIDSGSNIVDIHVGVSFFQQCLYNMFIR